MSIETTSVFKCDRCGVTGNPDTHYNTVGCKKYLFKAIGFTWFGMFKKLDVCKSCYEEFFQWYHGGKFPEGRKP